MESELKSHSKFIYKKIEELLTKHRESEASEELESVVSQCSALMIQCTNQLTAMKTLFNGEEKQKELKRILTTMREVKESLVDFEEKFQKYNVPRRQDSKTFEDYEKTLKEFMLTWKKEAEKGRRMGEKSLVERLRELGEERKSTLEAVKDLAIDIGINISRCLASYFWLLADSTEREAMLRNLEEVRTALGCLTVEGNSSVFIDNFLGVVRFANVVMSLEASRECFGKLKEKKVDSGEGNEILPLILREVLRFEVSFCCPDLPMKLTDELLFSMACHVREVIEKRLSKVRLKMDERIAKRKQIIDSREKEKRDHMVELLDLRINGIWKKLEL